MTKPHSDPRGSARAPALSWPAAWEWWADEAIPAYVKAEYSPKESWKAKPFGKEDASFFFKGISELSELFTEDRPDRIPSYFQHPRFRSSYLLYFLPLQAAKFVTAFELHPGALKAALADARERGVLRVADLGAGPGTASMALLLKLLSLPLESGTSLPSVEFDWIDSQGAIMKDGRNLAEQLASHFPKLRGKLTVRIHEAPWWEAPRILKEAPSLTLLGHVLNESAGPDPDAPQSAAAWHELWNSLAGRLMGGGLLAIEPAFKSAAQGLSRLRDRLLNHEVVARSPLPLWGPCLHSGACPLATGRDWCHFSVPAKIPGQWFASLSRALGSERQWVKFSYVWLASPLRPAPESHKSMRRVVSDPLDAARGGKTVLLCEPERTRREPVADLGGNIWRGDIVRISGP